MNKQQKLKGYLRMTMKAALRTALRIFSFVPVKDDRILFFAGMRGYTCNPKYVAEYLNDNYPGKFQLCWLAKTPEELEGRNYLTFIKYSPFQLLKALATSKVFVTNGSGAICPRRKKNFVVGTWHGNPYKKIGYDVHDSFTVTDVKHQSLDVMISVCEDYTEKCIHSGFHYHGRVINCGYPRNDIFFDARKSQDAANRVKKHYKLKSKVVLFAPTYRGEYQTGEKTNYKLDFSALNDSLAKKYGDDFSIVIRMHYFDKNQYNLPENVIDAGDWADMQELLCATDLLITDCSSTIWDFALTGRPCLLYFPDVENYTSSRGLYSDPVSWPGILCKTMDALCEALENLDETAFAERANTYLKETVSYEDGTASRQVCEEIIRFINTGKK